MSPAVYRLDHFGLDSDYDYDPFWQACVDLRFAPAVHSSVQYHDLSRSTSSYVFNHVNGIAKCHEALAKSLFLGGVTHRFPALRIGFLEGGVAWASMLYTSLIGHWEKRNRRDIMRLDPDRLDVDELMRLRRLARRRRRAGQRRSAAGAGSPPRPAGRPSSTSSRRRCSSAPRTCGTSSCTNFFMGCEADDPLVAWAFNASVNPLGAGSARCSAATSRTGTSPT